MKMFLGKISFYIKVVKRMILKTDLIPSTFKLLYKQLHSTIGY